MKSLNEMFSDIIILNELGGNLCLSLKFSDPDGVRSGKSGWSFAPCQFDTQNNPTSLICLRKCDFTEAEIQGVVDQSIDVKPLAAKLRAHADIVEKFSTDQLSYCLNKALNFDSDYGIPLEDGAAILAGADYVNQYGSQGQGAVAYYKSLNRPITAQDVLNFRFTTTYGKRCPGDCQRRYDNVMKIWNKENR